MATDTTWAGRRLTSFEAFEQDVRERAERAVTGKEAKGILRAAGIRGSSSLSADEARREAAERRPGDYRNAVRGHESRYRWAVRKGLGISYGLLGEIEAAVGVVPVFDGTARGEYASAADVRAVYDAAAAIAAGSEAIEARVTARDRDAAEGAVSLLRGNAACTGPSWSADPRWGDAVARLTVLAPRAAPVDGEPAPPLFPGGDRDATIRLIHEEGSPAARRVALALSASEGFLGARTFPSDRDPGTELTYLYLRVPR